jgi:hypothetical protein
MASFHRQFGISAALYELVPARKSAGPTLWELISTNRRLH